MSSRPGLVVLLLIAANRVLRDEALMRIHWGTTGVAVRIKAPFRPE